MFSLVLDTLTIGLMKVEFKMDKQSFQLRRLREEGPELEPSHSYILS